MDHDDAEFGQGGSISFVQNTQDKNEYFHRKMSNVNFDFHLNRQ